MSKRWLLVAVMLVACRVKGDPPDVYDGERLQKMFLESMQTPKSVAEQDELWRLAPPKVTPEPPPAPPPQPPPSGCIDSGEVVSFEANGALRACFDRNGDGTADRCVRWRPDGRPLGYDPAVDDVHTAESADEAPVEPPAFHSDTQHNEDTRITQDGLTVEVCAHDRACMKIMPRIDEEQGLVEVVTDADYRRAAIAVTRNDGQRAHAELWDLERGRAYAKLPFRGLMRDTAYTFSIRLGRGALVALAEHQTEATVAGAIYGLDGGFRGMLAGGARKLDLEGAVETGGLFLIVEEQADGKPYVLHAIDLVGGAAPGRFAIPRADDTATEVQLRRVAPGVVTAAQWGKQLRLDVIDARARSMRTLRAPGC